MINLKICLLGDGAVGKTALREQYIGKGFSTSYLMTIGADFALKHLNIDDYQIKFQIWDLAGQTVFNKVRSMYYRGTRGLLIVFDITRPNSFKNIQNWVEEIKKNLPGLNRVPMIVLGNKIDLRNESEPFHITYDQGKSLVEDLSQSIYKGMMPVPYFETSAKTGENVDQAFDDLSQLIIQFS